MYVSDLINRGDCSNRLLIPLSDEVTYDHLAGEHTVGVYPLLDDDNCCFLAVDFDEAKWRDDAKALLLSCAELGVPAALGLASSVAQWQATAHSQKSDTAQWRSPFQVMP